MTKTKTLRRLPPSSARARYPADSSSCKLLAAAARRNHMFAMITRKQWDAFMDLAAVQWTLFVVGVILIILSPVVGVIPGPGGVIAFGLGLGLVLKTSMWAKRHYVKFKRWQPKAGRWADWGLRRRSARRREALRRAGEGNAKGGAD